MVSFQLFVTLALIGFASALPVDKSVLTSEAGKAPQNFPRANGIAQGVASAAGPGDGVLRDTTSLIIHNQPDTSVDGLVPKVVAGLGLSARFFGLLNTEQTVGSEDTGVDAIKMGTDLVDKIVHSATNGLVDFNRRANGILQSVTGAGGVDLISGEPVEQSTDTIITGTVPKGAIKALVDDLVAPGSKRDTVAQGPGGNINFINGALSKIRGRQILNDVENSIGQTTHGGTANVGALVGGFPNVLPGEVPAVVPSLNGGNTNTHSDSGLAQIITSGADSALIHIPVLSNEGAFGDDPFFDRVASRSPAAN
ncbi:hypothetical protein BJ165DRAFT_1594915 [Panaeolus papilionaceus]|nr:hypothetical protein BJ165DRAFT_1594915 [Panaeolus papilionaceus]